MKYYKTSTAGKGSNTKKFKLYDLTDPKILLTKHPRTGLLQQMILCSDPGFQVGLGVSTGLILEAAEH